MKEARHKRSHTLYDSICMKYSEQANPQTQKGGWWLPGAKERGERRVTATGFLFGVMKSVLEIDSGDWHTTL